MVDTTKPSAPVLTGQLDNTYRLNWSGMKDDVGVVRQELWVDDKFSRQLAITTRTVVVRASPGPHKARIVVYDAAGNHNNSNTFSFTVPGEAPVGVPVSGLPAEPTGWRRIFEDDFSNPVELGQFPAAAPKWGAYPAFWQGSMNNSYYDAPSTVSIHDGMMDIWCRTKDGRRVTAAPIPRLPVDPSVDQSGVDGSWSGYYTRSARVAVRVKTTPMPGYKTAWLLWPKSDTWPRDGEIDFPEGDCKVGAKALGFMHRQNGANGADQDFFDTGVLYADEEWHTYVIEWVAGVSCQFFCDDKAGPKWTSRVPNTPMRYVLQTETELRGIVPGPDVQGHVYCDWITYAVSA